MPSRIASRVASITSSIRSGIVLFIVPLALSTPSSGAEAIATITVEAGPHARVDTPVSVALPARINSGRPLRLEEVRGDVRVPTPAQVESSPKRRLWWTLRGRTEPGATRRYELRYGVPARAEGVEIDLDEQTLDVSFGGARIFSYTHAHVVPPQGIRPLYIRSGYIHPVFSPGGKLITEDFPSDHHHHKGIWFPWTRTEFDGKPVDFWNLGAGQGTVQHAGFDVIESGPVYGRFVARHQFVDLQQQRERGGKVALDETWDVRVYAVGGPQSGFWIFDLTSTQRCASESPLHLKKYRYGGLGFRGAREWKDDNYVLLTSEGKTKKDGHTTRAKWCAHSGAVDGKWTTVVLMCSPSNERFPEPMRIWASGGAFFNYAPVQAGDWTLEPGKEYIFAYRFFVHEGEIDAARAEMAWNDFGAPPATRLTLSPSE